MAETYLVDAVRTPVGRRGGILSQVHPADLGAHAITACSTATRALTPGPVDDVIFGCVDTLGPQAGDIACTCWLAAGLPEAFASVVLAWAREPNADLAKVNVTAARSRSATRSARPGRSCSRPC
ncbi:MAG TPA: hypothetical protein VFL73_08860 [Solirubrobacteraceae bacterium]|nr:hypothetical protein [Solirubrobacteraceae bacterium]